MRLREGRSEQRDERRELNPPPHSRPSPVIRGVDEPEPLETLPKEEARCGRLSLLLPPDIALFNGSGTGTNGEAMFPELSLSPPLLLESVTLSQK